MSDEQKQADKVVMARILGQDIDGGPAFGGACDRVVFSSDAEAFQKHPPSTVEFRSRGMSLRDYFAAAALASFSDRMHKAANVVSTQDKPKPGWVAEYCYAVADAMLEARK